MMSEDNPYRFHVMEPMTSYRQRTVLELIGQKLRAFWFRNELLRFCVAWSFVGLTLWAVAILLTIGIFKWIQP